MSYVLQTNIIGHRWEGIDTLSKHLRIFNHPKITKLSKYLSKIDVGISKMATIDFNFKR